MEERPGDRNQRSRGEQERRGGRRPERCEDEEEERGDRDGGGRPLEREVQRRAEDEEEADGADEPQKEPDGSPRRGGFALQTRTSS